MAILLAVLFCVSTITATAQERPAASLPRAIYRPDLPQYVKYVQDPDCEKDLTAREIDRIKDNFWRSSPVGYDSVGMAVLNFRVNSTVLERDYMDNADVLDQLHRTFSDRELMESMSFMTITAAASPEGYTELNEKLSIGRTLAIKSYILNEYPFIGRDQIFTFAISENWPGLRLMVQDDPDTPYRREILAILDSDLSSAAKLRRLKVPGNGSAYRYLRDNMLVYLRGAATCMIYPKVEKVVTDTITITKVDTVFIDRPAVVETIVVPVEPVQATKKPYYFAVKTNLLYDALLLPDLALEFPFANRWSVEVGGQWSWWSTGGPKYRYHRVQFAGAELRKWLGRADRTPLTGHFLGLYGMGGTFDLMPGKKGVLSDGSYSVGLTYGYSMPIARRLNLEFSLGVGYMWGEYTKLSNYSESCECYSCETKNLRWIGPTKAEVSLVWLIGRGWNFFDRPNSRRR